MATPSFAPTSLVLCVALLGLAAPLLAAARDDCAVRAGTRQGADFSVAAARVAPAVVTVRVIRPAPLGPDEPVAGNGTTASIASREPPQAQPPAMERAFSSGFVIAADGWIVTAAHSVEDAHQALVLLADERQLVARIVGIDPRHDVALLKVDAQGLAVVGTAPDQGLCPGQSLAALGSPFGFERSVTAGVVSAALRQVPAVHPVPLIQTDIALNPGSSGGPLFDTDGRVVGMSTMIYSDSGLYLGVSFGVPIARVQKVVAELRSGEAHGFDAGLVTQPVTRALAQAFGLAQARGALVTSVRIGSPAALAGLRSGDVVLRANGSMPSDPASLEDAIALAVAADGAAVLEVWRGGQKYAATLRSLAGARAHQAVAAPAPAPVAERRLGLGLTPAAPGRPAGVYVDTVTGSALFAGIEQGDRISAVNGTRIASLEAFDAALAANEGHDVVALLVWRSRLPVYIAVQRVPQ